MSHAVFTTNVFASSHEIAPQLQERTAINVTEDAIAAQVDPKRCAHANKTGFASFADDCRRELADLPE